MIKMHFLTQMPNSIDGQINALMDCHALNQSHVNHQSNVVFMADHRSNQLTPNSDDFGSALNHLSQQMWAATTFLPNEVAEGVEPLRQIIQKYQQNTQNISENHMMPLIITSFDAFAQLNLIEQSIFNVIYILNPIDKTIWEHMILNLEKHHASNTKSTVIDIYHIISQTQTSIEMGRQLYRSFKQQGFELNHMAYSPANISMPATANS
jgi:hypothetical protein